MRIVAARIALVTAALLCIVAPAMAAPATAEWTANTDGVTTGYRVFYGTASGTYNVSPPEGINVPGVGSTSLVVDLTPGQLYFFIVRAYNASDQLGPASDEVPFTSFTDSALTSTTTVIKSVHVGELRTLVDAVRLGKGLSAFSWSETISATSTSIKAQHITELRTAVQQVYTALSRTPPTYTDTTLTVGTMQVKRLHLQEIRDAVYAIYP
jgi:hypothetical protein